MRKSTEQNEIPLSKLKQKTVEDLYKRTATAIAGLSISYLSGILLFTILFLLGINYCYLAALFPLFGYLWLLSFGSKRVNNHYGLKKTPTGSTVYIKHRQHYTTLMFVHAVIFLVYSAIRLFYETYNLLLLRMELENRKQIRNPK
jgi:hypothetical protein